MALSNICVDTIWNDPLVSEKVKAKVCAELLPPLGETDTAEGGELTLPVISSVAEVLWMSDPFVPVTVTVGPPAAAPEVVLIVSVEDPDPAIEGGLKLPETPKGSPDTERLTAPLKPFNPFTVTV